MKKPDIYIAIPTARDWKPEFGVSMIGLTFKLCQMARQGIIKGFYVNNKITSNISKSRQTMLDEALEGNFTHILFIDDDQQFPNDSAEVMLSRNKPWLAVNICKKNGDGWIAKYDGGGVVNSTGKTGVEQIGTMGLGMVMIELDAIRNVPKPHFEIVYMDEQRGYLGEDLYFMLKCKQVANIETWVDHDLSNKVKHVGNYGYGSQDVPAEQIREIVE